ncbi:semaphorin-7A isoform 2-T2 [Aulostomus maculatus]
MNSFILRVSWFLFPILECLPAGRSTHSPRMVLTDEETPMKRFPLPGDNTHVRILLREEPDVVTVVGPTHLHTLNFQSSLKSTVGKEVLWDDCEAPQKNCSYNISLVQERVADDRLFLCGTDGRTTRCCDVMLSEEVPVCRPADNLKQITESITHFQIKENTHSALAESGADAVLLVTYSGSQEYVGIHKFGRNRVGPASHDKEQQYKGLALISRREEPLQDRAYAFYTERDKDPGLYSEMWIPFVTRVCLTDNGGPKNNLQRIWTSQLSARMFCGDVDSKQHFSELVDVAIVHGDHWQDTRVYALFRNEWTMSAVCVYSVQDMDKVFSQSPFKGYSGDGQQDRPRECVADSTKISLDALRMIKKTTEMEQWIMPMEKTHPLLISRYNYTHIYVDREPRRSNSDLIVLFLSLHHGGVHKVMQSKNQTFVIAEYRPFSHHHVSSMILHRASRKLYVSSQNELVQLDAANCAQYGDTCQDCVLARDPYCNWNKSHCSPEPDGILEDVATRNHSMCLSTTTLQLHRKGFQSWAGLFVETWLSSHLICGNLLFQYLQCKPPLLSASLPCLCTCDITHGLSLLQSQLLLKLDSV